MTADREIRPIGVVPIVRPVRSFRPWLLGVIYALALIRLTYFPKISDNVTSRYMTIEAIVDHGTLVVDSSVFFQMLHPVDTVRFGGHYYSDKPPVLPAIASPVYAILTWLGYGFGGSIPRFIVLNLVTTWSMVGVCSALTLVWLRRMFQATAITPWVADLLTLGFGFGSQLLTYAVTFNNHSVAAGCLTGSMALTLLEHPGDRARLDRFGAGLLAGLAAVIDLPAGCLMLASLGLLQAVRVRSIPWAYLAGSVGPLLLHAWLQSRVTGTPLPAEMYPESFHYPGSYWLTADGTFQEYGPRSLFALELLVGPAGWLTLTPALAFGLVGLAMVIQRPGDAFRPMAAVVACSVVVLVAYYTWVVRRTDFGGQSFGVRHLLAITPAVYFFGVVALDRLQGWVAPVLFAILMGVGLFYAVIGVQEPWSSVEERERRDPALRMAQRFVIYPWSRTRFRLATTARPTIGPRDRPSTGRPRP